VKPQFLDSQLEQKRKTTRLQFDAIELRAKTTGEERAKARCTLAVSLVG
jgi:hypothetical protein